MISLRKNTEEEILMQFDWVEITLAIIYMITLYYTIFWLLVALEPERKVVHKNLKNWPMVTIVIPAYNEEQSIEKSIKSVIELDYPAKKLQLIAVDDGSTDSTLKKMKSAAKRYSSHDIMIISQKNGGKYTALNKGLSNAKGEFFVCLDADSYAKPDALRKMIPYFKSEKVGIVIPMMKVSNPKNFLEKMQWYEYLINKLYSKFISRLNCLHVAPGPFSSYRTKILRELGGFVKGHNTEDLEIALRMQRSHYKIIQVMEAEVTTVSPTNIKDLYYQRKRWNKGSLLNIIDYKSMVFNRNYGDFGMFYLPLVLLSGFFFLTIVLLGIFYQMIKPAYKGILNLSLVNFDIMTFWRNISFNFIWLDIDFYKVIMMLSAIVISITVMILAHRKASEKFGSEGFFSMVIMTFLYFLLLGVFWIGVFKDILVRKLQKW